MIKTPAVEPASHRWVCLPGWGPWIQGPLSGPYSTLGPRCWKFHKGSADGPAVFSRFHAETHPDRLPWAFCGTRTGEFSLYRFRRPALPGGRGIGPRTPFSGLEMGPAPYGPSTRGTISLGAVHSHAPAPASFAWFASSAQGNGFRSVPEDDVPGPDPPRRQSRCLIAVPGRRSQARVFPCKGPVNRGGILHGRPDVGQKPKGCLGDLFAALDEFATGTMGPPARNVACCRIQGNWRAVPARPPAFMSLAEACFPGADPRRARGPAHPETQL